MKTWPDRIRNCNVTRRTAAVRAELALAVALSVLLLVAAPILAGVIVLGTGSTSAVDGNGYGEPSSSDVKSFGLPGTDSSSVSDLAADGNANATGAASFSLSTDLNGVVTINIMASSSAFAQDFNSGNYNSSGDGHLAASLQLTSAYDYVLMSSGTASTSTSDGGFGAPDASSVSALSAIDFNGFGDNTGANNPFSISSSGTLGAGVYSLSADASSSASMTDFWNSSTTGSSSVEGTLTLTPAVPEPSTMILLGSGVLSLAAYGWRRRTGQNQPV